MSTSVAEEYAIRSNLRGNIDTKQFYAGALSWINGAGRNFVQNALVAEIRREVAAGKAVLAAGKVKVINVDALKQGNFPLSPKNKAGRSWMQLSAEGSALGGRRGGRAAPTAAPSGRGNQTHIQREATAVVETAENLAANLGASYTPGPGSGRKGRRGTALSQ